MTEQSTQIKQASKSLSFILGLVLIGVPLWYFSPLKNNQPETNESWFLEKKYSEIIKLAIPRIKEFYERGDTTGAWKGGVLTCPLVPQNREVSNNQLACHPLFLNCLLGSDIGEIKVRYEDQDFIVKAQSFWSSPLPHFQNQVLRTRPVLLSREQIPNLKSQGLFYELRLRVQGEEFKRLDSHKILLENFCKDTYLPKKVYVYNDGKKGIIWNSINKNIYVDKDQFRFWELLMLEAASELKLGQPKVKIPLDPGAWFFSAVGLVPKEMKEVCYQQGKELVQAHILDAGSYFPLEPRNILYHDRSFPPFPWSKRTLTEPIYQYQTQNKSFENQFCSKIYSRDCLERGVPESPASDDSVSWIGLRNLLGGTPEYVENIFEPERVFRTSSRFVPLKSDLNRVGLRLTIDEIKSRGELTVDEMEALTTTTNYGFRCMKVESVK